MWFLQNKRSMYYIKIFGIYGPLYGETTRKKVLWIGDINIDHKLQNIRSPEYKQLHQTLRTFGLVQTVRGTTHITNKKGPKRTIQKATTIDVILSNFPSEIKQTKVLNECIGDHNTITCEMTCQVKCVPKFYKKAIPTYILRNKCMVS